MSGIIVNPNAPTGRTLVMSAAITANGDHRLAMPTYADAADVGKITRKVEAKIAAAVKAGLYRTASCVVVTGGAIANYSATDGTPERANHLPFALFLRNVNTIAAAPDHDLPTWLAPLVESIGFAPESVVTPTVAAPADDSPLPADLSTLISDEAIAASDARRAAEEAEVNSRRSIDQQHRAALVGGVAPWCVMGRGCDGVTCDYHTFPANA